MRSINSNSTEAWRIAIDAISNYHAYTSGVVPAAGRWLFTRSSEEGLPLLALHPRYRNDDYCGVTFLVEATRGALVIGDMLRSFKRALVFQIRGDRTAARGGKRAG